MVKQTVSGAITPDTILHRFNLYNDYISKIRQQNLESGLDVKRNNDFVSQNKLVKQGVYEEFIQKTANAKNNTWFTLNSLQAAGVISDLDIEQFPSRDYPYFRLTRITRIKDTKGDEWLQFIYTIYALTKEGNAISRVISEGDFYYKPHIEYRYVPEDPNNLDGKQIHVGIVRDAVFGQEPTNGVKVQLTPYSKEKVLQTIEAIPPIGNYTDRYNGCGLSFIKEGEASKVISVTFDEITADNFEDVWNNYRGKNANAKVDVKELVSELQRQSVTSGENHQYG